MKRDVIWLPEASEDLIALYEWIAAKAGYEIAYRYTAAIKDRAATLETFAERGTSRDLKTPGIRSIPYKRRTIILYHIVDETVEIVRLAHGGRDLSALFSEDD